MQTQKKDQRHRVWIDADTGKCGQIMDTWEKVVSTEGIDTRCVYWNMSELHKYTLEGIRSEMKNSPSAFTLMIEYSNSEN